jgi:hypothetical protein
VARKRTNLLTVFLDDEEIEALDRLTKRSGLNKSDQVRQLIRAADQSTPKKKTRQR